MSLGFKRLMTTKPPVLSQSVWALKLKKLQYVRFYFPYQPQSQSVQCLAPETVFSARHVTELSITNVMYWIIKICQP